MVSFLFCIKFILCYAFLLVRYNKTDSEPATLQLVALAIVIILIRATALYYLIPMVKVLIKL